MMTSQHKRHIWGHLWGQISGRKLLYMGSLATLTAILTAILFSSAVAMPVAAQDATHALYIPVISTDKAKDEPVPPPPGGPSSEALIERARQSGTLDDETALLYRVYASFNDERLPTEYRGDDSNAAPTFALRQAQARMATLSPQTQEILAPFLLPPMNAESWIEQRAASEQADMAAQNGPEADQQNRIVWLTTCQTDPNIKVWYQQRYPEDVDDARALCELVRGTIWPRLTNLFGRTPPSDSGQNNNGGDGQLDLYLVTAKTATIEYMSCFDSPSYILVNNQKWTEADIVQAVMAAYLNGYSAECLEYLWLYDASLTWAIDYVLPSDNWEQTYADDFLNHTDLSLNTDLVAGAEHDYKFSNGAYLWLWYATNFASDAKTVMPAIWENATDPNSLAVVDAAVPGGFSQHWGNFSQLNWNNEPVENYALTDLLLHSTKPKLDAAVALEGAMDGTYELDGNVSYLAAHTYHFTFDDPSVRSVLFINPFYDNSWPTARVDAIYRLADGTWKLEEWTGKYSKEFCRDLESERVVDLTLVISNHEWKDREHKLEPAHPPRLNYTNIACRGWEFEGVATYTSVGPEVSINESTTIKATYMNIKTGTDSDSHNPNTYRVTEGTGSWKHVGQSYNCTADGSGTYELEGDLQTILFLFPHATDQQARLYTPGDRRYSGFGSEGAVNMGKLMVTYVCPDGSTGQSLVWSAVRWFMTETVATQQIGADGTTITGTFTTVDDGGGTGIVSTTVYEWTMKALPPE